MTNVLISYRNGFAEVEAADSEIGVRKTVPLKSDEESGKLLLDAEAIYERIKLMPDGLVELFEESNGRLKATAKGTKLTYRLPIVDPTYYPRSGKPEGDAFLVLQDGQASELFGAVTYAASRDNDRPSLSAVNLGWSVGHVTATTTDGLRLARKTLITESEGRGEIMISYRAAEQIQDLPGDVHLYRSGNRLYACADGAELNALLPLAQPAAYDHVLRETPKHSFCVATQLLRDTVHRVSVADEEGHKDVILRLNNGELQVDGVGDATDTIEVEQSTKGSCATKTQAAYLLQALRPCNDAVTVMLDSAGTPVRLVSGSYTALIMPMRLLCHRTL